jgi:hypothetical protein
MFSTLGIDDEFDPERIRMSNTMDCATAMTGRRSKKRSKRTRVVLNVTNILQSYDAHDQYDDNQDTDEVDEYFKTKLSITEDESILTWWKNRSVIYPR